MAQLESILGAMDRINLQMKKAVRGPVAERSRQIVSLRQEFTAETGNLLCHMPSDERLASQPQLFDEFQDRLETMRRMLASHQARWSIGNIDQQRDDYLVATDTVHGRIADYLAWARNSLITVHA